MAKPKPKYWILKSEPDVYPYSQLVTEKRTAWTGIRSFEARNNLRAMQPGDLALYYHSGDGKEVVGVARIATVAGPDPTAPGEDWAAVDVEPLVAFKSPVSLATLKATQELKELSLVKKPRVSVTPVSADHFKRVLKLGKTKLPA